MTRTYRILVAEDSGTVRDILCFLLEGNGYGTVTAYDGVEAVRQVLMSPPDLVLLDVDMPRLNGHQVCRLLKADPRFKDIPVVMLTGRDRRLDKTWGLSTGADAFLVKALDDEEPFAELGPVLERLLDKREPRPVAAGSPDISDDQVFSMLGGILDERLFRMSLRNRVNELGRSFDQLDDTVDGVIDIIEQAVRINGFALLLDSRSTGGASMWTAGRHTGLLEDAVLSAGGSGLQPKTRTSLPDRGWSGEPRHVKTFRIRARQGTIGFLAVSVDDPTDFDEVGDTVCFLVDNAALVLDNARLYAGLKMTLDELTRTRERVRQLEIIIDEGKRKRQVAEVVDSDYFKSLRERVRQLRDSSGVITHCEPDNEESGRR